MGSAHLRAALLALYVLCVCAACRKAPQQTCTVTFDANGGTGVMQAQQVPCNTETALVPVSFRYPGHVFSHWSAHTDEGETVYENGGVISAVSDITLYAQWTPLDPTLTINGVPVPESAPTSAVIAGYAQGALELRVAGAISEETLAAIAGYVRARGVTAVDLSGAFGAERLPDELFAQCALLENCVLPDGVVSVGTSAFSGCSSLTHVVFPDTVTELHEWAFYECSALTSVRLPPNLRELHKSAFSRCVSLAEISLPASLTLLGPWAFSHCESLTEITIPDGIARLAESAFSFCKSLQRVSLPPTLTVIEESSFLYCEALTEIALPPVLTELEDNAFYNCSRLKRITIPDRTVSIGAAAFYGCGRLSVIEVLAKEPPELGAAAFESIPLNTEIHVPAARVDAYRQAAGWKDYKRRITVSMTPASASR